jgi:hypothetical protein
MVSIERKLFQRRVFSECESAKEKHSEMILSEEIIGDKSFSECESAKEKNSENVFFTNCEE